jgi:hypothetical protein
MLQLVGCFAIWSAVVELCAKNLLFVRPSHIIWDKADPENGNRSLPTLSAVGNETPHSGIAYQTLSLAPP